MDVMIRSKGFTRGLLALLLLAGLLAGMIVPISGPARAAPVAQPICGLSMAQWTFDQTTPPPSGTTPSPSFTAIDVSSATAINGAGLRTSISTATGNPGNDWSGTGFSQSPTLDISTNDGYFQFAVDTTNYTGVVLSFDASRDANGPNSMQVYYSTNGSPYTSPWAVTYTIGASYSPSPSTVDLSGLTSSAGVTYIRIYGWNAGGAGGVGHLDNVTFTGCQPATPTPTSTDTGTPTDTPTHTNTPTATYTPTVTSTATPIPVYSPLSLVINEIGWMGTTTCSSHTGSGDEWVEFYNPGSSSINLSGWALVG